MMDDGLIHRPDGRVLDSQSKKEVSGANSDISQAAANTASFKLSQSSNSNTGYKAIGTIMDNSDSLEVRTTSEKEDFQKAVEKGQKM